MIYYYLTIALQVYCCYHVYKNGNGIYWYFIIFFIPVVGSLIYLFTKVFNSTRVLGAGEQLVKVIQPTREINKLLEQVKFADTYTNRVALGDAYAAGGDYQNAQKQFEKALVGNHKGDNYILEQLIEANFKTNHFQEVIDLSKTYKATSELSAANVYFYVGQSYRELKKYKNAAKFLKRLDVRYSNYKERLVLAQFLREQNKEDEAKELLEALITESNHLSKPNRKMYRATFLEIQKLREILNPTDKML